MISFIFGCSTYLFRCLTSVMFSGLAVEVIIYAIIESYTRKALNNTGNYLEKQEIWFEECAVMAVIMMVIYIHHLPYFLLFMFLSTLILVPLRKRVDFRELYKVLKTYYEDSKEHQEQSFRQPYRFFSNPSTQEDTLPPPNVALIGAGVSNHFVPDHNHSSKLLPQRAVRISNHSTPRDFQKVTSNLSAAFLGHFRPRGLLNENENLCFFNCVLQVLARTDGLLGELMRATVATRKEGRVLDEIVQVLASLTNPEPSFSKPSAINTTHLRKLLIQSFKNASDNKHTENSEDLLSRMGRWLGWGGDSGCLLEEPGSGLQREEDVAELFMWLLQRLETELMCTNTRLDTEGQSYLQLQQWWQLYGRCGSSALQEMLPFYKQQYKDNPHRQDGMENVAQVDWLCRFVPLLEAHNYGLFNFRHLFTGQMSTTSQCDRCLRTSINVDVFKLLPVPLPTHASVSVEDVLARVTRLQTTTPCHFCSHSFQPLQSSSPKPGRSPPNLGHIASPIKQAATANHTTQALTKHSTFITLLPPYFVVQLLRFKVERGSKFSFSSNTSKLPTRVSLSTHPINLHAIFKSPTSHVCFYHLYAVVMHHSLYTASTNRGHYSALVRVSEDGGWCLFNDHEVTAINNIEQYLQQPEVQQNAYLLFYAKVDCSPS